MSAATAASLLPPSCFRHHLHYPLHSTPSIRITSSLFRPDRRRRRRRPPDPCRTTDNPPPPSGRTVDLSLDLDELAARASASLSRFYRTSEYRLRRFLSAGEDAYHDLRTSVHIDGGHRIIFSCRRSSLLFCSNLLVWGVLSVLAIRVLTWLGSGLGLRTWWDGGSAVVRRDRSLAGREVVIGRRFGEREVDSRSSWASVNPLSPPRGSEVKAREALRKRPVKREPLPKWWPKSVASPVVSVGKQEYQAEANRLVRAVDLVLNSCSRLLQPSATVLVDGEEARQFICGLAENIGLENVHAARLVRAAVAARTRASLLQSWALEVQGRRLEALEELSKIRQLYLVFPPEDSSPEMEMVASGLKKNLGVEQREHLLNLFKGLGGAEVQSIAAEALGLRESST